MRYINQIEKIDYNETKTFFKNRANKFKDDNPYSVTMYQDNNPDLVKERNRREVEKIYPLLNVSKESKILDVACGVGRWADTITGEIEKYCGIDFSGELIEIASKRIKKENFSFFEGSATEITEVVEKNNAGKFNIVLLIGILVYLNDEDVVECLKQVEQICEGKATICVREPVGISDRLTLKNFFSEELNDDYNAIYRSKDELMLCFEKTLLEKGFRITKQEFLFDEDSLNNRKETAQYYYIFERE